MLKEEKNGRIYPPWTTEFHGLHALIQASSPARKFCWFVVMSTSVSIGCFMAFNVVMEYWSMPTATRIALQPVQELLLPRITLCPRNPDAFHKAELFADMRSQLGPDVTDGNLTDLLVLMLGGNGLKNVDYYMSENNWTNAKIFDLEDLYIKWRGNRSRYYFFHYVFNKYSYKCNEMLLTCSLGPVNLNCCEIFTQTFVMNRGKCFSSAELRQADADEIGKLTVQMKQLPSIAMSSSGFQTQMMIYISKNSSTDIDEFSRYYIDMNVYNRMRFTAQRIRFLLESSVCTNNESLIDSTCYVRQWYEHDVLDRFNCSFAYMHKEYPSVEYPVCPVGLITSKYYKGAALYEDICVMGCDRWNYDIQMMVYSGADRFKEFKFSLEASFTNLQFEDYEQIRTISIFGLIAQMGGQLGLFAGMSLLTIAQIVVYYIYRSVKVLMKKLSVNDFKPSNGMAPAIARFNDQHPYSSGTRQVLNLFPYEETEESDNGRHLGMGVRVFYLNGRGPIEYIPSNHYLPTSESLGAHVEDTVDQITINMNPGYGGCFRAVD